MMGINRHRVVAIGLLAGIMCATAAFAVPPAASASTSVPFLDHNSIGSITLCGRNDQAVTSGNLLQQPFVWKAISSSPAPKGYTRAYLTVYQPIQHEDPRNWTGYPLTAVSVFSNPKSPVAQATNIDAPLLEPHNSMPPYWDGFYELRMLFTGPNEPAYNQTYPSAVIQVDGNDWTLIAGGHTACSAGQAVSVVSLDASKSALASPHTVVVGPPLSTTTTTPPAGRKPSEGSTPGQPGASSSASTTDNAGGVPNHGSGTALAAGKAVPANSSSGPPGLLIGVLLALVVAVLGTILGRRLARAPKDRDVE